MMAFQSLLSLAFGISNIVSASPVPQGYGSGSSATVDLGYAKYEGVTLAAGVNEFLGMRYSAPPLGNLRWRAPQDPLKEDSPQFASAVSLSSGSKQGVLNTQ